MFFINAEIESEIKAGKVARSKITKEERQEKRQAEAKRQAIEWAMERALSACIKAQVADQRAELEARRIEEKNMATWDEVLAARARWEAYDESRRRR